MVIKKNKGSKGFTYPAALAMILVTSISLMGVQKYWSTTMRREREKALLFNGGQIYNAIESYYRAGNQKIGTFPRALKDLLRDPRFGVIKRHLRRIYPDPMTVDGQWQLVLDGQGNIRGVFSRSLARPLKQNGFPEHLSHFKNKTMYSEWKFVFEPTKKGG